MLPSNTQENKIAINREKWLVVAICVIAALRIFLFSAAFPIFNHVDERAHYDLVYKYSQGYWPNKSVELFDAHTLKLITLYSSPEYLKKSDKVRPPLWKQNSETIKKNVSRNLRIRSIWKNHEAQSPPVYYAIAGAWLKIGNLLGFKDVEGVYWIRFLNVFVYAILVWLAYIYCGMDQGGRFEIRLGAPLLVAFFPQDVFYGINSDVLSPLFFTLTLIFLSKWWMDSSPSVFLGAAAGFCVVLTILTKLTNIGLLLIFTFLLALRLLHSIRQGYWRSLIPSITFAALFTILPLGLWMIRNYMLFGDLTGNGPKIGLLGWTFKPLTQLFDHPMFTLNGAWGYLRHVILVYWRGEYHWFGKVMEYKWINMIYIYSSLIFLMTAAVGQLIQFWHFRKDRVEWNNGAGKLTRRSFFSHLNWSSVILGFGCLAALSLRFEFANTAPSRQYPFFAAGRLAIGMIVPFAILYNKGLTTALFPLRSTKTPFAVIFLLVITVFVSELLLLRPVLNSAYNWFHLP